MNPLPTLPITGMEGTWQAVRDFLASAVLPALERGSDALWQPNSVPKPEPMPLPFASLGKMEARERPYPSVAPTFLFCLAGEGVIFVRNRWFQVAAGQGVFIPHNCPYFPHGHFKGRIPESHWLWVGIHPFGAALHHCLVTPKAHYRSLIYIVADERVALLFREWEAEISIREMRSSSVSRGLLTGLFSLLSEATALPLIAWAECVVALPELPFPLRQVVSHIFRTYDQPLRLSQLARRCGMSPYHFCRYFRRHLGVSPLRFVLQVRLEAARQLLAETRLPPSVVAPMVGFSNYRHFRSLFQKRFGTLPTKVSATLSDVKIASLISKIVP